MRCGSTSSRPSELDQLGHLREVQRRQRAGLEPLPLLERGAQLSRCAVGVGRSQREAPAQGGQRVGLASTIAATRGWRRRRSAGRRRPPRPGPRSSRVGQGGVDGAQQHQALRLPASGHGRAEFRQQQCQFARARRSGRGRVCGQHTAQQARQHRIGTPASPGPRLHDTTPGCRADEVAQQSALADAGFARQQEARPRRPRLASARHSRSRPIRRGGRIRLTGATGRRAGNGRRRARSSRSSSMVSAEGRVPSSSFRRCSKSLERRDRGGAVAAQVVQPHHAALACSASGWLSTRRCA